MRISKLANIAHPNCEAAVRTLRRRLELAASDLASLKLTREFARRELAEQRPLRALINNEGVMAPPKRRPPNLVGCNPLALGWSCGRIALQSAFSTSETGLVV